MSKAKFAGSPDSISPFGRGEGLCVVVNENLRANLRAFFSSWHQNPGPLLIVPVLLGMNSTTVFIDDNLLLLQV